MRPRKTELPLGYQWIPSDNSEFFGKFKTIKNKVSKEICLVGRYGQIWEYSDKEYACVVTSPRIAKKYLPETHHPVKKGDEILYRFPKNQLTMFVKILKIGKDITHMIKIMENLR